VLNQAAVYHRPDSEYAYLLDAQTFYIQLRVGKGEVQQVFLVAGDSYTLEKECWGKTRFPMKKGFETTLFEYWEIEVTAQYKRLAYGFVLHTAHRQPLFYGAAGIHPVTTSLGCEMAQYFRKPYFHEVDRIKVPTWVQQTVWYQIFPDRFANGDSRNDPPGTLAWNSRPPERGDFFGGDLQGIIDHLPYLATLGVNGIYLGPLFLAPSNHKYDTTNHFVIDPAFGDQQLFSQFVAACHKRGMRVMLDAVFNHVGEQFAPWQDVLLNGAQSPYRAWFHIRQFANEKKAQALEYEVFSFNPHLPKLNTANPEVQRYLLDVAAYWLECGIDGYRLDAANEVDHAFWQKMRRLCEQSTREIYLVGEVWHEAQSWLLGNEFHGVTNYRYGELVKKGFSDAHYSPQKLLEKLNEQLQLYPKAVNAAQFNVLDSHDTPRLLTELAGNKALMMQIVAFLFMQPGIPVIYYGDEIGLSGGADPLNRGCMVWENEQQDQELLRFYQTLIVLRKRYATLFTEGTLHLKSVEQDQLLRVYRTLGKRKIIGIFNFSTDTQSFTMPMVTKVLLCHKSHVTLENRPHRITLGVTGSFIAEV
jgi:glycosidase